MNDNIIAPPVSSGHKNRELKENKTALSDALSSNLRKLVYTDDNRQIAIAQAMAERPTNIAVYAESNTDAIAAQKLIYERVQGKAAVVKVDESKPMPKVIFSLTEESLDKVNDSRTKTLIDISEAEDDGSGLIVAEIDGKAYVG